MTIKQKLIIGYLAIALMFKTLIYFGIKTNQITQKSFNQFTGETLSIHNELDRLKNVVNTVIASSNEITLILPEEKKSDKLSKQLILQQEQQDKKKNDLVKNAKKDYYLILGEYEKSLNNYSSQRQTILKKIKPQSQIVIDLATELIELKNQGVTKDVLFAKSKEVAAAREIFLTSIDEAIEDINQEIITANNNINYNLDKTTNIILLSGLISLCIVILIATSVSMYIANPINNLKNAALDINQGKLKTQINITNKDEFGTVADAFNKMSDELQRVTAYLVSICESMVESLIVVTPSGKLKSINKATSKLLGYRRRELFGHNIRLILPAADTIFTGENFEDLLSKGFIQNIETSYIAKSGHHIPILFSASVMRNSTGKIMGIVCVAQDITERQYAEKQLDRSLSILRATLESTADGILVVNEAGEIAEFNQKFIDMWQIPEYVITGKDDKKLLEFILKKVQNTENFYQKIQELYAQPEAESFDIIELKNNQVFERYSQPQRIGGKIVGRVWSFRDITHRKQAEEIIRYQAWYDQLTGLPNRMLFNEKLSVAVAEACCSQSYLAVMFLDLDRFKKINDTLGHAIGDLLLKGFAQRISKCLRENDTAARWGGDEFTILLSHINCKHDAAKIAERILQTLKPAFYLEGHPLHISSSIGIAIYPDDGANAETLVKNADTALYRAKDKGRNNYQFYISALNDRASELLTIENQLHHALDRGEFQLYYQPKVNINSWEITGTEALIRWQHPQMGLISPHVFIPIAEENGLIIAIGEWVLQTACTQNKIWLDAGLGPIRIAVNLSPRQFQQRNLVETITEVLSKTGLEPQYLELEITETVAMQNIEFTKETLQYLHNMGVQINLDDFGTGYSSLGYLKNFPFHALKIDQSFIRDLTTDKYSQSIATAVAALGNGLNLSVVAEGVETQEQLEFLRHLECEEMQGYLFSQPLSVDDATVLLQKQRSKSSKVTSIVDIIRTPKDAKIPVYINKENGINFGKS